MSGAYLVAVIAVACGVVASAVLAAVVLPTVRRLIRVLHAVRAVFAHDVGLLRARKAALAVALRQRRAGVRALWSGGAAAGARQPEVGGVGTVPSSHQSRA